MKYSEDRKKEIFKEIIQRLCNNEKIVDIAAILNISRPTVNRYRDIALNDDIIQFSPEEKKYFLVTKVNKFTFDITKDSSEDIIFNQSVKPLLGDLIKNSKNVYDKISYCFTEMVNNVIDHSKSDLVHIDIVENYFTWCIIINDYGVGIFKKLMKEFEFSCEDEAIFQLSLGKLTTDTENHTGEGIFFSSKIADIFSIESSGHTYTKDNLGETFDFGIEPLKFSTSVKMIFFKDSKTTTKEIFDEFTDEEDMNFNKTIAVVELASLYSKTLISRSEAKRIAMNFKNFKVIMIDFKNVEYIGQGFADQLFRVFVKANPEIEIKYKNANVDVEKMIKHVTT